MVIIKEIFDVKEIMTIHRKIFGKMFPYDSYIKKLEKYKIYFYAYYENLEIIGYSSIIDEENERNLYAWYGGLIHEYQGRGITVKFFDILVTRARNMEYKTVSFATTNCRPHMLRLAIKYGFDISDIKKRAYGEGNKIYFKYNVVPIEDYVIDLKKYNSEVKMPDFEKKLVLANKYNCKQIVFENYAGRFFDVKFVLYAIKYCNSFIHKPKIIVNGEDDKISKELRAYNK